MKEKFFIKCLKSYIRDKIKIILLLLTFALIFLIIFYLYRINLDGIIYASVICSVIGLIFLFLDFFKFYRTHKTLTEKTKNINFSLDNLPLSHKLIEKDYQNLIKILYSTQNEILTETASSKKSMQDYYAMWVHQIKVPISAMHLLLDSGSNKSSLKAELFKIEQYVEMVLSYIRLEAEQTDYVIKEHNLDAIVKQAVRKYAPLFISKKIKLEISPIDAKIITDEKWFQFVIEQILSNSLKYTKTGTITIYTKEPASLIIEDTGIGISPEDINRIGEKGFTGYNGHLYKKSTGLGLYLCKEILKRLSHRIFIESEPDKGTRVLIDFETRKIMME